MKILKLITPFTIALVVAIIGLIDLLISLEGSGGWSSLGIMIFVPLIIGGFFIDFYTRIYFKNDVKKIWLYEFIIIIVLVVVWLFQRA